MNRIIFESSSLYIILCASVSVGLAFLLYKTKQPWGATLNKVLFVFRAVLIFFLTLLLLNPIVKQIDNLFEKPAIVILLDNSASVTEVTDSVKLSLVRNQLRKLTTDLEEKGYDMELRSLNEKQNTSDFTKAFRSISSDYENKKIANVVFVSDGIYNAGVSPLYSTFNFPIQTIALGDTTARIDVAIKNMVYNKIAYQGNLFPIVAEISAKGFLQQDIEVSLLHRGKLIEKKSIQIVNENLTRLEFQPLADEQGIQRYEIQITREKEEWNTSNNRATAFVEVVSGKKKILAIASAPHPDIKALRSVIDQNSNYEFNLYIPGVIEGDVTKLQTEADLIILFQIPDLRGRTKALLQQVLRTKASLFFVLGEQTDWQEVAKQNLVKIESAPRQFDDVTPSLNNTFNAFTLSEEIPTIFNSFPPTSVPFVKIQISPTATPLLFQKIGSVVTEKPLLFVDLQEERKVAVMLGEGLWRWRLHEYARNENTEAFDEVFGKLLQYMSTTDDRRKFRSYPIQQQFSDTEAVVFESQVYNDIFEPIFGNTIELELTDEAGKRTNYRYTTGVGNTRYTIGRLKEGVYRYKASTSLKEKEKEEVRGEFLVLKQQLELQNLTADFDLLRKLSTQTGGSFYKSIEIDNLKQNLTKTQAVASIHTEEKYDSVINLKWIFFLLLLLISVEWFLRKYYGGY
jgi:hypothetical protein